MTLRSLRVEDLPQLVALRRKVFKQSSQPSDVALADYYRMLFFESPWHSDKFPSTVEEGLGGEILGFIGSIPRPMTLGSERITVVTSTELMVAPEARGLLGPKLLRHLFAGPQEVTLSDRSNALAKALYESSGGSTALWYSLYWNVSLDGTPIAFQSLGDRTPPSVARRAVRRAGRLLDRVAANATHPGAQGTTTEPLSPDNAINILRKVGARKTLIPDYDTHAFSWLLDRVGESQKTGRVITAQVALERETLGWFIYVLHADKIGEVVQLVAVPGRENVVLDQLMRHAYAEGARVLRGRLDRRFAPAISEHGLPLTLGEPWTVVHSGRADLANQFLTGNALLTRLDSEWWIGT